MPERVAVAIAVALLVAGCVPFGGKPIPRSPLPTAASVTSPVATATPAPSLALDGTVQSVALSAQVIFLSAPVMGVTTIAIAEGTRIVDDEGNPLTLRRIGPGCSIRAIGRRRGTGDALLAAQIIVHDPLPSR